MEPALLLDPVIISDALGKLVNPASEESLATLRRMARNMESLLVVDSLQRQRVAVETLPTVAAVTTVATVSTVSNVAAIGSVAPFYQFVDLARTAYNSGIRNQLTFA